MTCNVYHLRVQANPRCLSGGEARISAVEAGHRDLRPAYLIIGGIRPAERSSRWMTTRRTFVNLQRTSLLPLSCRQHVAPLELFPIISKPPSSYLIRLFQHPPAILRQRRPHIRPRPHQRSATCYAPSQCLLQQRRSPGSYGQCQQAFTRAA